MPSVHVNDATYQRILAHKRRAQFVGGVAGEPAGELKAGVITRALDALEKLEQICAFFQQRDVPPRFVTERGD